MLKFGFGYQTVNDLYPNWILRKLIALNTVYEFATQAFPHIMCIFLMNCLVVDNLTVESPARVIGKGRV